MVGGVVAADDRRAVRVSGAVVDRGSKTEFFSRISHLFAHHRIVVFPWSFLTKFFLFRCFDCHWFWWQEGQPRCCLRPCWYRRRCVLLLYPGVLVPVCVVLPPSVRTFFRHSSMLAAYFCSWSQFKSTSTPNRMSPSCRLSLTTIRVRFTSLLLGRRRIWPTNFSPRALLMHASILNVVLPSVASSRFAFPVMCDNINVFAQLMQFFALSFSSHTSDPYTSMLQHATIWGIWKQTRIIWLSLNYKPESKQIRQRNTLHKFGSLCLILIGERIRGWVKWESRVIWTQSVFIGWSLWGPKMWLVAGPWINHMLFEVEVFPFRSSIFWPKMWLGPSIVTSVG